MHPAMQRRRRQLLTRRGARRGSQRRGLLLAFVVVFSLFGVLIGGTVLGAGAGALFWPTTTSPPACLTPTFSTTSRCRSRAWSTTGPASVLLARFECQNRESVRFDEIPNIVVDATVASEDQTFWTNNGVDVQAVARAAYANLQAGSIVQGASTITQQVIKYAGSIVLTQEAADDTLVVPSIAPAIDEGGGEPTPDEVCPPPRLTFLEGRGFEDKIREQIMAMQVTAAYPGREGKELILATYLNLIFYGNGSYGIKAAAANYFGLTDLSELTLSQAAFLSALPQRPSALDPYQNAGGAAGLGRGRRGRHARAGRRAVPDARGGVHHPRGVQRGDRHHLGGDAPQPGRPSAARAPLHLPRPAGDGPHPRRHGRPGPGAGGPDRRLPDHHHPRLPAPAGGPLRGPALGGRAWPTRTSTTGRWWPSTRRPARSSPTSAASTTTTRPTRGSRASSTSPASPAASRDRPSSPSSTPPPSRRARRRCRPCSWTP